MPVSGCVATRICRRMHDNGHPEQGHMGKGHRYHRRGIRGFTLVELLVVIAIIVVLIAIALPALSRALYAADLARCGANLKGIANGASVYAVEHQRAYPYRAALTGTAKVPHLLAVEAANNASTVDDRPYIKDYYDLKNYLDPMVGALDLSAPGNNDSVSVYSNYAVWYGMSYTGFGGLKRMGGKLTFRYTGGASVSFAVMAGDIDAFQVNSAEDAQSTHPDRDGAKMAELHEQNAASNRTRAIYIGPNATPDAVYGDRGRLDLNYAFADGGVQRYADVRYDESPASKGYVGERFARVPYSTGDGANIGANWFHLPRGE